MLEAGSQFMQRLGALSSFRAAPSTEIRAQAGGAETIADRYRVWLEGYRPRSRTDAQDDFSGDRRRTAAAASPAPPSPSRRAERSGCPSTRAGPRSTSRAWPRADASTSPRSAPSSHTKKDRGISAPTVIHGFGDIHSSRFRMSAASPPRPIRRELWGCDGGAQLFLGAAQHTRFVPRADLRLGAIAYRRLRGNRRRTPVAGSAVTATPRADADRRRARAQLVRAKDDHGLLGLRAAGRQPGAKLRRAADQRPGGDSTRRNSSPACGKAMLGADAGATLSAKVTDVSAALRCLRRPLPQQFHVAQRNGRRRIPVLTMALRPRPA